MIKTAQLIGISLTTCIISVTATYLFLGQKTMTKVHKLEFPLILSSDMPSKNAHLLPKGTVLYFDKSYPEGFTRYKVYINVDRTPLKLEELTDPTTIDPIDAAVPGKSDLIKLLRDYPLTKSDLESILETKRISKEEIKEVLQKFSE